MTTVSNRKSNRFRYLFFVGSSLLVALVVGSSLFAIAYFTRGTQTPHSSTITTTISKGTKAQQPTSVSTNQIQNGSGFTFTAAGDYGQTNYTTANLNYITHSGASFHLGLGDFDYDPSSSPAAWAAYAKSHLPANFPFEIVTGGHDLNNINTLAADLPNHIGDITGTYAKEYYFDYPPNAPLARFIVISPSGVLPGYDYGKGTSHYNWVSQQIDGARAAHIHWVIVAMHQYCFVIDSTSCANQDLLDMLLNKHVDLILQAQKHTYQASKQLALNTLCPVLPITTYNPHCVVNATTSMQKGVGSVIVVTGTGGTTPQLAINTSDPKIHYFRAWAGANVSETWGVSQFTVTATQITMHFVPVSGSFRDGFTITG